MARRGKTAVGVVVLTRGCLLVRLFHLSRRAVLVKADRARFLRRLLVFCSGRPQIVFISAF